MRSHPIPWYMMSMHICAYDARYTDDTVYICHTLYKFMPKSDDAHFLSMTHCTYDTHYKWHVLQSDDAHYTNDATHCTLDTHDTWYIPKSDDAHYRHNALYTRQSLFMTQYHNPMMRTTQMTHCTLHTHYNWHIPKSDDAHYRYHTVNTWLSLYMTRNTIRWRTLYKSRTVHETLTINDTPYPNITDWGPAAIWSQRNDKYEWRRDSEILCCLSRCATCCAADTGVACERCLQHIKRALQDMRRGLFKTTVLCV